VNLGVDFGSTGLRAAYAAPGADARFVDLSGPHWPWLLCEPISAGDVPVRFPSLKSKLGVTAAVSAYGRPVSPPDLVSRALKVVRERVEAAASSRVGKTIISVPARYTSSQRSALRDAAQTAGLTETSLINDSVSAAIQWGRRAGRRGTILVYAMGYSGFELGLIRAEAGRYQVLGYEGDDALGGSTFDRQVLTGWIAALRSGNVLPDMSVWDMSTWLQLRTAAELVKQELSARPVVPFGIAVLHPDRGEQLVHFTQPDVEAAQQAVVAMTLEGLRALLERCGLTDADLDAVLLVGGSTRLRPIQALVEKEVGRTPYRLSPEDLARGALRHADLLGGVVPLDHLGRGEGSPDGSQRSETDVPAPAVVIARPEPEGAIATLLTPAKVTEAEDQAQPSLEAARRLIDQRRPGDAVLILRKLIAEAQALLDQITADDSLGVRRLLKSAHALLEQGKYDKAVQTSHRAWQEAPNDPDIFEGMIDVHCQAAMAEITIERFADAERWLRCAYGHDQSNVRVRELLAERTFQHARQLGDLGRRREASRFLDQCLVWDPEHDGAKKLRQRIARGPSAHS
jgi:hypothetical protein